MDATSYVQIFRGLIVAGCQLVPPDAMAKACSHNVNDETDSQCPMLSRRSHSENQRWKGTFQKWKDPDDHVANWIELVCFFSSPGNMETR